jgi:hypothetical protein
MAFPLVFFAGYKILPENVMKLNNINNINEFPSCGLTFWSQIFRHFAKGSFSRKD